MRLLDEANRRFDEQEKEWVAALSNGVASSHEHYKFITGQIDGLREARKLLVVAAKFLDSDAADPEDAAPAVMMETRDKQRRIRGYGES
jgi:hypothetical protein